KWRYDDRAEVARHRRLALKRAREEPQMGFELDPGANQAFAVFPADLGDFGDAVEHQHRRQRQLRALRKQLAPPAREEVLIVEIRAAFLHPRGSSAISGQCFDLLTYWHSGAKAHPHMPQPHSAGAARARSGGCGTENCRILISSATIVPVGRRTSA